MRTRGGDMTKATDWFLIEDAMVFILVDGETPGTTELEIYEHYADAYELHPELADENGADTSAVMGREATSKEPFLIYDFRSSKQKRLDDDGAEEKAQPKCQTCDSCGREFYSSDFEGPYCASCWGIVEAKELEVKA
jgi:hypothetical protein